MPGNSTTTKSKGGSTVSPVMYVPPRRTARGLVAHFPTAGPVQVMRGQVRASPSTPPAILSPLNNRAGGGDTVSSTSVNNTTATTANTSATTITLQQSGGVVDHPITRLRPMRAAAAFGKQPGPLEIAATEASTMIERELRILLGDKYDGASSTAPTTTTTSTTSSPPVYSQQRLSIFRSAARMLLPQMPPTLQRVLDRIVQEFEHTVAAVVASERHSSFEAQRARLEAELRQHYKEQVAEAEASFNEKRRTVAATEHTLELRVRQLENLLVTATEEARRQKRQSSDEAERFSQLAQSLVDARYTAQQAEITVAEMQKRIDQIKTTERIYKDLLRDHNDMRILLDENKITFKSRVDFSVEDLIDSDEEGGVSKGSAASP